MFDRDWRHITEAVAARRKLSRLFRFLRRAHGSRTRGKQPLAEDNFEAFKLKLRCIFCEHLLSAHARAQGIPLVDIRPQPLAIDAHG